MNSINSTHHLHPNGLGSPFVDIFSVGAGLVDSFIDARTERKSDESDERQLQLQLQAQREQAQMNAARLNQILKIAMIAGGVLLTGGIVIAVIKSGKTSDEKKGGPESSKKNNIGKLEVLDGLKRKPGTRKKSLNKKAA